MADHQRISVTSVYNGRLRSLSFPARLRSADNDDMIVPRIYRPHSFHVVAPQIWNTLPARHIS